MGTYTEIIFGAELKKETPKEIILVIQKMTEAEELGNDAPFHPFFDSSSPWLLTSGGSYYFPGIVKPHFWYDDISECWYLHFRTNIKNYDGGIEKFLDWIKPYIDGGSGKRGMYAIVTHEYADEPTIYYLKEKK